MKHSVEVMAAMAFAFLAGTLVGSTVTRGVYTTAHEIGISELAATVDENKQLRADLLKTQNDMAVFRVALSRLGLGEHVELVENKITVREGGLP
jgi:hypothetical protein